MVRRGMYRKKIKIKDEVGGARAIYSLKGPLERDTIRLGRFVYSVFMVEFYLWKAKVNG